MTIKGDAALTEQAVGDQQDSTNKTKEIISLVLAVVVTCSAIVAVLYQPVAQLIMQVIRSTAQVLSLV